jgi:hypothetical protein
VAIKAIHAFLIHPGKGVATPAAISGKKLDQSGKLFELLRSIFMSGPDKRDFEVTFKHATGGTQQNDCRDDMIKYATDPTLPNGRAIAKRLQAATDNRSGIGLLFLICGDHGLKRRLIVSRFPANEAILAEIDASGLDLQFLEQVFIRRLFAYKALLLEHQNPSSGFWSGMVTDRQAGGTAENISHYWMTDFLTADFSETPAAGTRRLAEALKKAIKANPSLDVKSEIASAVTLAKTAFSGKQTSVNDFCSYFGFSNSTQQSIVGQLPKAALANKMFKFDVNVFQDKLPYRTVEIENGAILTAPSGEFDDVFKVTTKPNNVVEYSTTGKVADERIARQ